MALHLSNVPLKTRSGLEPVPRCEPSTYQSLNQWVTHIGPTNVPGVLYPMYTRRFKCTNTRNSLLKLTDLYHSDWSGIP